MRFEHSLYFLWDRFEYISNSQCFEIVTTPKEIMSLHDHGVIVFRFDHSNSEPSSNIALSYLLVNGGLQFVFESDSLSAFR